MAENWQSAIVIRGPEEGRIQRFGDASSNTLRKVFRSRSDSHRGTCHDMALSGVYWRILGRLRHRSPISEITYGWRPATCVHRGKRGPIGRGTEGSKEWTKTKGTSDGPGNLQLFRLSTACSGTFGYVATLQTVAGVNELGRSCVTFATTCSRAPRGNTAYGRSASLRLRRHSLARAEARRSGRSHAGARERQPGPSLILVFSLQSFCPSCTSCTSCSSLHREPRGLNPNGDKTSGLPFTEQSALVPAQIHLGHQALGASGGRKSGTNVIPCHAVPNPPPATVIHRRAEICGYLRRSNDGEKSGTEWQFLRHGSKTANFG
jgi:hypothetical protein